MGECRSVGRRKSILLTNYFCYVSVFQPLQCPSVERTFYNRLYVYGRGRRRCGGPTIQADRFPLVGNAHRAFRGGKHGRMPFGQATGKHKIDGTNTQCNYFNPCNVCPSNARFVIFCMFTVADAAGAAALQFRRKTRANDVRNDVRYANNNGTCFLTSFRFLTFGF